MTCFGMMPVISFYQMTKHTQFHRHPLVIFNINFYFSLLSSLQSKWKNKNKNIKDSLHNRRSWIFFNIFVFFSFLCLKITFSHLQTHIFLIFFCFSFNGIFSLELFFLQRFVNIYSTEIFKPDFNYTICNASKYVKLFIKKSLVF